MESKFQYASSAEIPREEIYMTTHMGLKFHHFCPSLDEINILDVAKGLSQNCRYNGQTPFHYSVAQHSLLCDDLLVTLYPDADIKLRRTMLLHDGAETYVPDVHSCVKHKLPDYLKLLRHIEDVFAEKFDLYWPEPAKVKQVDGILLSTELVKLMRSPPHIYNPRLDIEFKKTDCELVELAFLKRWEQLKP